MALRGHSGQARQGSDIPEVISLTPAARGSFRRMSTALRSQLSPHTRPDRRPYPRPPTWTCLVESVLSNSRCGDDPGRPRNRASSIELPYPWRLPGSNPIVGSVPPRVEGIPQRHNGFSKNSNSSASARRPSIMRPDTLRSAPRDTGRGTCGRANAARLAVIARRTGDGFDVGEVYSELAVGNRTSTRPRKHHPMPSLTPRRLFLIQSGRAALGLSVLPLAACSRPQRSTRESGENPPTALIAELEAQIPPVLAAAQVPGLSIAIVRDARNVWSRGFGVRNSVSKARVDTDTLFEVGSVSKTVFAYAVMKLCEKGVLDLDRPLTNYVSERWIDGDPRFGQITARHVLSHTSGLQNWRSKEEPLRIDFTPGSRWEYSGEGYSYLQLVVAHLTGRVSTDNLRDVV